MSFYRASVLAIALAAMSMAAQATTIALAADGQWNAFTVSELDSQSTPTAWIDAGYTNDPGYGSALNYTFTIGAGLKGTLTVVDADFAGDTFHVFNQGQLLGSTSSVPVTYFNEAPADVGYDFDAALQDGTFSHGVFTLVAGTYSISGALAQSVLLDRGTALPLNSTGGALKLSISAVPEPGSVALLLAALGVVWLVSHRKSAR